MRQEGQNPSAGTGGTSQGMGNSPSVTTLLTVDSNSLSHPPGGGTPTGTSLEDLHHHHMHHPQSNTQQTLAFSDIY